MILELNNIDKSFGEKEVTSKERKPFSNSGKGLILKNYEISYASAYPFIRTASYSWPETIVSVQHSGRSPDLKIIAFAIFPVSQ